MKYIHDNGLEFHFDETKISLEKFIKSIDTFDHGQHLHRIDGPAYIYADGDKAWYYEGRLHNLKGPAVINSDGEEFYFIHGHIYSPLEWLARCHLTDEEKVEFKLRNA